MDIQLKVMGQGLFQHLSQAVAAVPASFPAQMGGVPVVWKLVAGAVEVRPEDLLCNPDCPCVLIVEAHDSAAAERIRAMEERVHAYIKHQPDLPMVLCPIILVFQSPVILVDGADFPDIVSDWMFLPVSVSDLAMRVGCALKRKGMLKSMRNGEGQGARLLSEREVQILKLADAGMKNGDLAGKLFLSETTVKWHLRNIYTKFNVGNRNGAIARARELGLL